MKTVLQHYKSKRDNDIDDLLMKAVDESLSSLGDTAKQAVYFHLENSFKIKRTEIPSRIDDFASAMEQIFGRGAKLIEIEIMKRLFTRVGDSFDKYPVEDDLIFRDYMRTLKMV